MLRPVIVVAALLLPMVASAASFGNPLAFAAIQQIVRGFVLAVIYVGTPAVVVYLMWAGLLLVYARGNPDKLNKGKETLVRAAVGGTVFLSLWAIVQLVGNTVAGLSAAAMLIIFAGFFAYVFWIRK